MKLREIREAYEDLSRTCSSTIRSLALSGIAISWLFIKEEVYGCSKLLYILAMVFFVFSLFSDLMQSYSLSKTWYKFYSEKRKQGVKEEEEVNEPEEENKYGWFLYRFKLIMLIGGYVMIVLNLLML